VQPNRLTRTEGKRLVTVSSGVRSAILAAGAWAASWATEARASAFIVEARTEAQAYQIRAYRDSDPDHPTLLPRRRIVQYLGVNGFELITGEDLGFETSMRVFADFGLPNGEAAKLDGVNANEADLLYAYARFRTGPVEMQLGRQTYVDITDYMAFDGLKVRYLSGVGLGAEAYGGLWVKGGMLLGSSVYQPDGTRESDKRRISLGAPSANPALDDVEPVYGAKLLVENIKGISGSLGYRKALLGGKTDLERAAAELRYGRGRGLNLTGGLDYDLMLSRVAQVRAQVRWDHPKFALSAEALRASPVLAAESIWYYFATGPRDELRLRGDYTPVGPLRYYVQAIGTKYNTNINHTLQLANALSDPALSTSISAGGSAGAAYHEGSFRSALDVSYRNGYGGRQLWVDLTGGYTPEQSRYTLDGRFSVASVADGFNPLLQGTFYGAQVWVSYLFTRNARGSVAFEENINGFTRSDFKFFFLFDLKAIL
jgi:hypothetical protein